MRKLLVAGNWKMNGSRAMAAELCRGILDGMDAVENAEVAVCPPFILIPGAARVLKGGAVALGAQDMDINDGGAYTGQTSSAMLKEYDCKYVILGHSERRAMYGDTDQLVAEKVKVALANGLIPIFCVGETLEEREGGVMEEVVGRQLDAVLAVSGIEAFADIVIAYEPVWAIGTGKTATPDQAQAAHASIRGRLAEKDQAVADGCRILYGGSMKPDNAQELIGQPDIDGGLIGGAALQAEDFLGICRAAN